MILDTVIRTKARLLTGSTYAILGFQAAKTPGGRVGAAGPTIAVMRKAVPVLPADDELIVRVNGAIQSAAGVTLALGLFPRISALVITGSMIPTTIAGHGFWTIEDPAARAMQRVQFQKNLAMIGGLLFAAIDTPHKRRGPSRAALKAKAAKARAKR
ncbi:DoxX family protein [Subtercola lobariae]|uniref:DoxX family protein n=1 Tax=Subtercola lobariae TaxID=1588641 RepID=A0A917F1L7_9MICO|nr:DoxX family protein [Subtercola lobariae]GGF39325.1 hypothetical protein GCM10011399_35270 [Subtercola lobariae]